MGLSIAFWPRFGSILIEPIWSCLGQVKNCPKQLFSQSPPSWYKYLLDIVTHKPPKNLPFNSTLIIETHPSTSLIKTPLTPYLMLPLFNLSPNIYISTVKGLSKYFTVKQLFPWKIGAKGQIYLMLLFSGDRPLVHLQRIKEQNSVGISLKIIKH